MDGPAALYVLVGLGCVIVALGIARAIPQIIETVERIVLAHRPPERWRPPADPPAGPWGT